MYVKKTIVNGFLHDINICDLTYDKRITKCNTFGSAYDNCITCQKSLWLWAFF